MRSASNAHGFTAQQRLRTSGEFDRAFRDGRRCAGRSLAVWVLANGLEHSRLGLAVGRAAGTAVSRSRVRRLIREAFRLTQRELPRPCDIVAAPLRSWNDPPVAELAEELAALVTKALSAGERR